jgi:hypothetical protein
MKGDGRPKQLPVNRGVFQRFIPMLLHAFVRSLGAVPSAKKRIEKRPGVCYRANGRRERVRRVRQILQGQITPSNGLIRE